MKVRVIKGMMTLKSHRFKPGLRVREPPRPQFGPPPATPEMLMAEIVAENSFIFKIFHGPLAARPHGWPLQIRNGKVRKGYLSDITRETFERIKPILEAARKRTRPRPYDLYDVWNRLNDVLKTG